jgi:hypothetical protein
MAVAGTDSLANIQPAPLVHLVLDPLLHQQPIDDRSPGAIGNRRAAPIALKPRRLSDVVDVAFAPSPTAVATKTSAVGFGVTALPCWRRLSLASSASLAGWSPDSRRASFAASEPSAAPAR